MFVTEMGNLSFGFRAEGGDLTFDWQDFSARGPDDTITPCGGDDSEFRYRAYHDWKDFYVYCVEEPASGPYTLLYRGTEVADLSVP